MNDESPAANADGSVILGTADGRSIVEYAGLNQFSRRHMLMGAAMLGVSGLCFARMPTRQYKKLSEKDFEALFPKTFGRWRVLPSSEFIMPPESDLADATYEHVLTRTYVDPSGQSIMLLAAYNSVQVNNVQVHRPEICYYASGFAIKVTEPYDVQLLDDKIIPARAVKAERSLRNENIIYWTRIGDRFPQSWLSQRIQMTMSNLEGYYADGLLVRASIIENDADRSFKQLSSFLRDFESHCSPEARQFLFRT